MQVTYFTVPLREPSPGAGCKSALPWLNFTSYFLIVWVSPITTYDSNKSAVYSSPLSEQFQGHQSDHGLFT